MTAQVLALPTEDPEEIAAVADAWTDACQPESHEEQALVNQMALSAIRLGRIAGRGGGRGRAGPERDGRVGQGAGDPTGGGGPAAQEGPGAGRIELKSFSGGVEWLLQRWTGLKDAFVSQGLWNTPELIQDSLRLDGIDPNRLEQATVADFEKVVLAVSCHADFEKDPAWRMLLYHKPAEWLGRFPDLDWAPEQARKWVLERIEERIAEYTSMFGGRTEVDEASREGASRRAEVLADTGQNRLMLRYMRSAEMTLDRSLKTLQTLQKERAKRVAEGPEAGLPNEADPVVQPPVKEDAAEKSLAAKPAKSESLPGSIRAEVGRRGRDAVGTPGRRPGIAARKGGLRGGKRVEMKVAGLESGRAARKVCVIWSRQSLSSNDATTTPECHAYVFVSMDSELGLHPALKKASGRR